MELKMKKLPAVMLMATISSLVFAGSPGKSLYKTVCQTCHAPDAAKAIGAPAAFDKKAWDIRFAQAARESTLHPSQFPTPMDYLLKNVIHGKKQMPHSGLCHEADVPNKDCSVSALSDAVRYMSQHQSKNGG